MRIPRTYRLVLLGAAAAASLAPYAADSGTCATDQAAMDLLATSWAETQLNGPKGEDTNFFTSKGGIPNILVLMDTTGSMNRLPPDGPNYYGEALPPGYYDGAADQTAAYAANDTKTVPGYTASTAWKSPTPNTRIVGCGLDPVSAASTAFTSSAMYKTVMSRRFYPPCGTAVDPTLVGAGFKGQTTDYAAQMTVCPYFTSSNSQAVGAPGFDPDYYSPTDPMATSSGSKTNFFGKDLVFHDNPDMAAAWTRDTGTAFGHNFGGGFFYDGVAPHLDKAAPGDKSTVASFCKQQGTTSQGSLSHESICNTCLTTRGWYYDGVIYQAGENAAPTPSVWYTGNYLSFFPPKFLIARKVLKDIVAVQSRIRMAMATFSGSGADFVQPFNPSCGMPDNSSFDSNRASYVSSVDGFTFSGGTPMSVALFDVGRYYHSPDLEWFGTTWENSKMESSSTANQYAVCYACQSSNVILITDGQPSGGDGSTLPTGGLTSTDITAGKKAGDASTGICGVGKDVCPECAAFLKAGSAPNCGDSSSDPEAYKDSLAKVAFYLHNLDLRDDGETTLDCKGNGGKQWLDTYTIGFATGANPSISTILGNAAKAGGGIYIPAENTQALKEGFFSILEQINGRSTSFSVATVSTLQTTEGSEVLVPRFSPAKTAHWPGHLYRYQLYSEFVQGCTPKGTDDYDCDGRCEGAYLEDKDGDFISEDANGFFQKNNPSKKAICAQVPACGGSGCAAAGSAPATHFWDAMYAWHDQPVQAWKHRNVFTVVDDNIVNGDGIFNDQDKPFKVDTSTDDAATKLLPYLALGGGTICNQVSARFITAGYPAAATLVAGNQLECAKSILRYVLGADLFNERGISDGSYPPASQEDAIDREFLLGDIFHSSPVIVTPPSSSKGVLCGLGLSKQCLVALWSTETPNGKAAYDEFQAAYATRNEMVLVGANDGMLHAFDNDGYTSGGKGYTTELWAFIPPDLLPKLPLLLGSEHHLFVDGNPMVREVWVDGTTNGKFSGAGANDDIKQKGEFHTVAVVGERRGGTRYFALDVTDAADAATTLAKAPRLLWLYPQPGARESITFAETYNEYLPTPPPIGPVRVAIAGTANADAPKYTFDGSNTPFHETWITFLSGGYDPQYVRGRGVHMVNVWTGAEIFDFSYPDDPSQVASDDPRLALRFPIAGTVGMSRWGEADTMKDLFGAADMYFDTATFGDTGGQLWTLRFHEPAKLDAKGLATNWFGARLLQMSTSNGTTNCKLCGGQPFFYITANGPTPSLRYLRVYAGTGDRFNLTDTLGGTCSPTNLRACVLRGCTVTVTQADNLLSAPTPGFTQRGMSAVACADLTSTQLDGTTTSCAMGGHAKVDITCTPERDEPGITSREAAVACSSVADGYSCSRPLNTAGRQLALAAVQPNLGNWFFSLRAFRSGTDTDPDTRPLFKTAAAAKIYDAHRMWVHQNLATRSASAGLTFIDSSVETTTNVATEDSNGWAMHYNHGPTVPVEGIPVTVDWRDERTSSGTILANQIVAWNTIQPALGMGETTSTGSCRLSRCTQENRRVNYLYGADPVSGGLSPLFKNSSGNVIRSMKTFRLVPAQSLQLTYFVDKKGRVQTAATGVSTEQGAVNVGASEPEDPVTEAGSIIIDKELYQCRHAKAPVCN